MIQDNVSALPEPGVHIQLRLRLPLLSLLFLLATTFLLPDRVWNTLLIGLGGMFITAFVWIRLLANGLEGYRSLQFGWVSVGDQLEEKFEIHNNSAIPALWVEVLDYSNVPGYAPAVVRSVGSNDIARWRESSICTRRGQFILGPWSIRTSDPFGIFMLTRHYETADEIIIHPPVHGQLPVPLPTGQSGGHERARQRAWHAVLNAATVRDYQPTDPQRWIHWPTSARRDSLFVREFDLDAAGDIWVLLDLQTAVQLGSEEESTEEHAVLLAAALASRALQQNRAVGLAGYGQRPQVVPAGRGRGQQWRILRALALVHADGESDLSAALRELGRTAQRGVAVIIITASGTADWIPHLLQLAKQGIQSQVVLLDRPSFGGEGNSDTLRTAVHQLGFDCFIIHRGEVGQPLETQQRRGFWDFRVTGTGRVVVVQSPLAEGEKMRG